MAEMKTLTRAEVAEHKTNDSLWMVIDNKVYDVTKFLEEVVGLQHPGGEEVLLEQGGGDGTESFEDVGHSTDAREMRDQFLIGHLAEEEKAKKPSAKPTRTLSVDESILFSPTWTNWLIPTAIAILVALVYRLIFGASTE